VTDQPDYTPAPALERHAECGLSSLKTIGPEARVLSSSSLETIMRITRLLLTFLLLAGLAVAQKGRSTSPSDQPDDYSGMYSFTADGEFVQISIEDGGKVTGYVSRYGSLESDKGAFLDHFIKTGSIKDRHLEWRTEPVHGVWYEFKGTVGRGNGKTPDDEGYYTMRGTLVEHSTDAEHKESARQREVVFKSFPQDVGAVGERNATRD
jgi:hypothetical protein